MHLYVTHLYENPGYSIIALHYGVLVVKAELDQILCGLSSTLNALTLIRNNPLVMRPLFIHQDRHPPTADTLFDMFQAKFSELGSNAREAEEATMMKWSDFLQMVEGKETNSDPRAFPFPPSTT